MQFMVLTFRERFRRAAAKILICAGLIILFSSVVAQAINTKEITKGAYLVRVGDCVACHTAAGPKSAPFAGGLPLRSPFGVIYSTNITPDPMHGIGRYTLDDFSRAVRDGIAKDGRRLYPAMPYPSYSLISDEDIRALYAYFRDKVTPVNDQPPVTKLRFPFNLRWSLFFWDAAFVKHQRYKAQDERDAQWNRGAYLVQSLGHCGTCHTPRGIAFQEKAYSEASPFYLRGELVANWFAANLTGDLASGLGRWSEADIVAFLKNGSSRHMAAFAFGSMNEVIRNSTQYLSAEDLQAIAHYLKSIPASGEQSSFTPDAPGVIKATSAIVTGLIERPGVGIYQTFCAKCHLETGNGQPGKYPKLAGNSIVLSDNPASLIHLLVEGSQTVETHGEPESHKMPAFGEKLTNLQIAEVLSFVRNSWGNRAPPVTLRQVSLLRNGLN